MSLSRTLLIFLLAVLTFTASAAPLSADKKWGAELNPFRLLLVEDIALSGGVSYFDHRHNAEIAFPFFNRNDSDGDNFTLNSSSSSSRFRETNLDVHYRKFLGPNFQGLYLSAFARATELRGDTFINLTDRNGFSRRTHGPKITTRKIGVGIGIGLRRFFSNGIYVGASLMIGRYFDDDTPNYINSEIFSGQEEQIIDIELLKIGYAF